MGDGDLYFTPFVLQIYATRSLSSSVVSQIGGVPVFIDMNKTKEKKLRKQIVDLLKAKKLYEESDQILIDELIDFMKISEYWKNKLMNEPDSWQAITTLTCCSKQIQSLMVKLSITPSDRSKIVQQSTSPVDVHKLISE